MQRGNGAVIGKQNTPTTSVATGVWALNEVQRAVLNGTWPAAAIVDPYFEYNTLLLHGNGTNGAQNNTFLDSSTNNFTITRNGNTTQGTFTPYGSNWSNYFDGSGDYLTFPNNASMPFGTGSFTIEFWINGPLNNDKFILGGRAAIGGSLHITTGGVSSTAGALRYVGSSTITSGSVLITDNAWHHVAIVRNGSSNITLYIDGVSVGTGTDTTNYTGTGGTWVIGANDFNYPSNVGSNQLNAYLSNLRIVKSAVYTANFTPPTAPLTVITNTQLLTCADNRFIDDSSNNFTITRNGDVSVQRFSPFNPTAPYSAATIGGSGYFDGSGDYLSVADNAALDLSTGDFTIECWVFPITGISDVDGVISKRSQSTFTGGDWRIAYRSSSTAFGIATGSNNTDRLTPAIALNAWNHIAFVRSSGTLSCYANGARGDNLTWNENLDNGEALLIGLNTAGNDFPGYISNVRIVKGSAVYSGSTYTVPTAPLTAITNTSLLLNFTNGGIIDNAMMNDLETVGNAQISTSVSKFGGGSMAFDGSGDGLLAPSSPNLSFGSGDFTVEGWVYFSGNLPYQDGDGLYSACLFGQAVSSGLCLIFKSGGSSGTPTSLVFTVFGVGSSSTTISTSLNTWYHIAVTKASGTVRVFLNGVQQNSFSNSTTFAQSASTVGYLNTASYYDYFLGNIDDLRITRGYARYTANFTPPTLPFPDQ